MVDVGKVRERFPDDPVLAALDDEQALALAALMASLARSAAERLVREDDEVA